VIRLEGVAAVKQTDGKDEKRINGSSPVTSSITSEFGEEGHRYQAAAQSEINNNRNATPTQISILH
jgi:hypothetical protein